MGSDHHVIEIVTVLNTLTAHLALSEDIPDALAILAETTANLVDAPASSVVTATGPDGLCTVAVASNGAPDHTPDLWTQVQYDTGRGPCVSAIAQQEMTVCQDLTRDQRWPGWAGWVVARGLRGVLSAPVDLDEEVLGGLTLYTEASDVFGPDVELAAMFVAEQAGLLLAVPEQGAAWSAPVPRRSPDSPSGSPTVRQAITIVVAQLRCSEDRALAVLCRASDTLRLPLEIIAERLVDTVTRQGPPPPRTRTPRPPSQRARIGQPDPLVRDLPSTPFE